MRKLKILVAYDGTDFCGWQIQPRDVSVVQRLQDSFKRTFGQEISLLGASRTDAGVHALGQVASFRLHTDIDPLLIKKAWNQALSKNILIRDVSVVDDSYHPFKNVAEKTYWYHFFYRRPLPFIARYGWYYPFIEQVNFSRLQDCLRLFEGTHDFASFCTKDGQEERSTIRTINSIALQNYSRWGMGRIVIKGPSFVRFQIRRMIGYSFDVARRKNESAQTIKKLLDHPNHCQEFVKADAQGLCLRSIRYQSRIVDE